MPKSDDRARKLRLLSNVGQFIFIFNPASESTVIIRVDEAKALELKVYGPPEQDGTLVQRLKRLFTDKK
jgi:hypothetical protein